MIGFPVFDEFSNSQIALIQDIIIDPETGKVLAFLIKNNRIIAPLDVQRINSALSIENSDRILPLDDILRVYEVYKMKVDIIGAKVITERKKLYLGRVFDFAIDTTHMTLTNIYVAKIFFLFRFEEKIISYKNIVRINKNTIIVKDLKEALVKEKVAARSEVFA